jgi:hypothetical protein
MPSQITCITKPDRYSHHEHITRVGGVRHNGLPFNISREECADDIRLRRDSYFVRVGQNQIGVEAYELHNEWFIKTLPDHTKKDNLLNLDECRR